MLVFKIDREVGIVTFEIKIGVIPLPTLLSRARLEKEGAVVLDQPVPLGFYVGEILTIVDHGEILILGLGKACEQGYREAKEELFNHSFIGLPQIQTGRNREIFRRSGADLQNLHPNTRFPYQTCWQLLCIGAIHRGKS